MALLTEESSFGVLDGVKIIYLAVEIAVPAAAAIMAEWRADVTWIENVQIGDSMRDTTQVKEVERRNMRSVSMNPFTEDGKEASRAIVKDADISVESSEGPVYTHKGITDELLWEINPKLVIVYVSGFGQWGDEEQINSAAYSLTVAAYAGVVAQNGSIDQSMNASPYLGDYINSLMIISPTLAALHRVGITSEGRSIDMTMYETLLRAGICCVMDYTNADIPCPRLGACHQNLCGIDIYECKDGFIRLCLYEVSQNKYLLGIIGLGHLWGTEEYPEGTSALWFNGPKADLIQEILEEYLKTQLKFDVQRDFVAHRITAQVVSELPDVLAADRVGTHECFINSEEVDGTPVKALNTFPKFHHNPGTFWRPMPALGENTRDVLEHARYSDEDIGRLVKSGTIKVRDEGWLAVTRSKIAPENTIVAQLWERQVKDRGEHRFLVFENTYSHEIRHLTYRRFDVLANRCANALTIEGIGERSQMALYLDSCVEFVGCALVLAKMGAVSIPIDATSAPSKLGRILGLCQAQTLITCTRNLGEIRSNVPGTIRDIIVAIEGGNEDEGTFPDLPRLHEFTRHEANIFMSNPRVQPQDMCETLSTSGATSAPKGMMITHTDFVFSDDFVNWELDVSPEGRCMTLMVATRVNYQLSALVPVLTLGATLIMLSHYHASCFRRQACLHRITLVQGMAMIVATVLRQPVDPEERDHQVREMHYFLPLSTRDKETFKECFSVSLLNSYGSTEYLIGAVTDFLRGERRWPSIGKVGPGYKIHTVDDEGSDLPEGEVGELVLHGVPGMSLMAGYWDSPEATAEVLDKDGQYYTHDYTYVEDDWVYFMDQRADLIKHSGESVSSAEVGGAIEDLPGVREVAVIGVPDGVRDQAVRTFIIAETNAALDAEAVIDHCAGRLAAFKVSSFAEFIEELPRDSYGKVQRHILANS